MMHGVGFRILLSVVPTLTSLVRSRYVHPLADSDKKLPEIRIFSRAFVEILTR